jgi:hypothetical protein
MAMNPFLLLLVVASLGACSGQRGAPKDNVNPIDTDFRNFQDEIALNDRALALCPAWLFCGITVATSSSVLERTPFQVQRREDLEAGLDSSLDIHGDSFALPEGRYVMRKYGYMSLDLEDERREHCEIVRAPGGSGCCKPFPEGQNFDPGTMT